MRAADMGSAAAGGELISEVPRKPKLKFLVELFARSPRRHNLKLAARQN